MSFIDLRAKCVLALAAALAGCLWLLPEGTVGRLTGEGKLVENISSVLLGIIVIICGLQLARTRSLCWLSVTLTVLWMYMRELDYQRQFTSRSVESIGFFRSAAIPAGTKLIVLAALVPFVLAGLHVLLTGIKNFKQAYRQKQVWIGYAALAAAVMVPAMIMEKLVEDETHIIEEVSELAFAGFVLLLVLYFSDSRNSSGGDNRTSQEGTPDNSPDRLLPLPSNG